MAQRNQLHQGLTTHSLLVYLVGSINCWFGLFFHSKFVDSEKDFEHCKLNSYSEVIKCFNSNE